MVVFFITQWPHAFGFLQIIFGLALVRIPEAYAGVLCEHLQLKQVRLPAVYYHAKGLNFPAGPVGISDICCAEFTYTNGQFIGHILSRNSLLLGYFLSNLKRESMASLAP